jgi:hypothetical protein
MHPSLHIGENQTIPKCYILKLVDFYIILLKVDIQTWVIVYPGIGAFTPKRLGQEADAPAKQIFFSENIF